MKPKLSGKATKALLTLYLAERRLLIRLQLCGPDCLEDEDEEIHALMDYGLTDTEHNLTPLGREIADHLTHDEAARW